MTFDQAAFIEPANVPEYFVNGIAKIEDLGGNIRFSLYSLRSYGEMERVVLLSIIVPTHAVRRVAMQAIAAADTVEDERVH
jgi:hypothetical protein